MKRITSAKFLAATAVALGAFVAASAAHARTDVYFSIGVPAPVYVQPAPVYVEPAPVYVQPAPVYVQPRPVYVAPRPVYVQPDYVPAPRYYGRPHWERRGPYGDGFYHQRHHARRFGPYGDMDRDGIMNRDDRDRDGDGVRNRRDRFPNHPGRG